MAVEATKEQLNKMHKPVKTKEEKAQIATISSNDREIGNMIAEAIEKVGAEGVITVEEGKTATTQLDVVEGMFHQNHRTCRYGVLYCPGAGVG